MASAKVAWCRLLAHTRDLHCIPLVRTASMTASTFFRRSRMLALRVLESFQGVFLRFE
jgi:hypothetical protein